MEEVRSDIFTVLANIMESPHTVQNSQSNNNNSNPVLALRGDPINRNGTQPQTVALTRNSQIEASVAHNSNPAMNSSVLDANIQAVSTRGAIGVTSDADMAEIERISSTFPHLSFPGSSVTVSNASTDSLMYDGDNHVGMVEEVANGIDPRLVSYPSNSLDFSQNPAALLEALSSIDKDNFNDGSGVSAAANVQCLRAEPAHSFAQSFVSMLQQQQMDSCGNLWPMNSVQAVSGGSASFNGDISGNKQAANMRVPQSVASPNNTCFSPQSSSSALPSNRMDGVPHSHFLHNTPSSKAALLTQQSRMPPSDKVNLTNQHYSTNPVQQYNTGKLGSKNRNLILPIGKEDVYTDGNTTEGQSKEKKLTTTPIPSDADKSSISSSGSSSGSVSGPEHSPDHNTDRVSRGGREINLQTGKCQSTPQLPNEGGVHNLTSSKNYPYNNVNIMNFNTINFSPVMEGTQAGGGEMRKVQAQDLNVPVPTSDSVVEIDETVTSPLENIPVSPPTPTSDANTHSPPKFTDANAATQKTVLVNSNHMPVMHHPASNPPLPHHTMDGTVSVPTNATFGTQKVCDPDGRDSNNNTTQFFNKNPVNTTQEKFKDSRQKKPRRPRHQQQNHRHKNGQNDVLEPKSYHTLNLAGSNMSRVTEQHHHQSNLTPKVNADPTRKKGSVGRAPSAVGRTNPSNVRAFHLNSLGHNGLAGPGAFSGISNLVSSGLHKFGRAQQPSTSAPAVSHKSTAQPSRTHESGGRRQWQTVTAVQGPKLPPVLSEQDRIPKRGRPSKKMMQENLKIKANAAAASTPPPNPTTPVEAPTQKVPPTPPPASKLVSTYTINDKGLMEEIAPKPKENRRSKERTQAFLKLLNDIKCASKQNKAMNPKFGEKAKTGSEKQPKKRAKPRTKVFGRHVAEPLTESGITETMYTFSALAYQYKISSSIVERATENLLKSAAMKRSKDQSTTGTISSTERLRLLDKNNKKGVLPPPISHCENATINVSSKVLLPTVQSQPAYSKSTDGTLPLVSNVTPAKSGPLDARATHVANSDAAPGSGMKLNALKPSSVVLPADENFLEASPAKVTVPDPPPEPVALDPVTKEFSPKLKTKKKKHKKHKKHKHIDSKPGLSGKKKKKKKKKKPKVKVGQGALPSSSVSVAKPPLKHNAAPQASASLDPLAVTPTTSAETSVAKSSDSLQQKTKTFTSHFQRSSSTTVDNDANDWQPEDNAYDGEDSSSDDASTSPKSYPEPPTEEKQVTLPKTGGLSSFARYSDSPLGFGMLTSQKQVPRIQARDDVPVATVAEKPNNSGTFSSGVVRSKKHHKHNKRKRFSRKPRNICNPALLVHLDEVLDKMKNMALTTGTPDRSRLTPSNVSTNVFLAVSANDNNSNEPLWRMSTVSSPHTHKSDSQAGIVKGTTFRTDSTQSTGGGGKLADKPSGFTSTAKKNLVLFSSGSNAGVSYGSSSLSVFCSSPFFQKYGYISKLGPTSPSDSNATSLSQMSRPAQPVAPAKTGGAACVPTNTLSTVPSMTEKVQETNKVKHVPNAAPPASKPAKQEKRKRGWPRGKPRGPRAKKVKTSGNAPAQATLSVENPGDKVPNSNRAISSPLTSDESNGQTAEVEYRSETAVQSITAGNKTVATTQEPGTSTDCTSPTLPTSAESDLISESLLVQIKQAIEASLPAHPSVNKDAITKSVDAVVQSYLQKMNQTQESDTNSPSSSLSERENTPKKRPGKRSTRTRSSVDSATEAPPRVTGGVSSRTNADKHPKKLWACKHHDTETLTPTSPGAPGVSDSPQQAAPVKKRGPGRPRKVPLPDTEGGKVSLTPPGTTPPAAESFTRQGKLPTASATVVPMRRKTSALRMQGVSFKREAVRMRGKCGRPRSVPLNNLMTETPDSKEQPASPRPPPDVTITKERAFLSLDALYSAKALRSKSRVASFENVEEPGLYMGTMIEQHIKESIDNTVDQYSWDNYKKFNEACTQVERDMGFLDENENAMSDSKRRASGPKKSIESVVEKLKNKQAQSMHSAAAALLQLRETQLHSHSDKQTVMVKNTDTADGYQDSTQRRQKGVYSNTSTERGTRPTNTGKKHHSSQYTDGFPLLKRPRGRPRKHPLPDQDFPWQTCPTKKQKTHLSEQKHSESKKSSLGRHKDMSKRHVIGNKDKNKASQRISKPTAPPTKSFLEAGLYSSTFKMDSKSSSSKLDDDNADSHLHPKLPPPFDAGLYLRSSLKDFQLPYNIWWMYKHRKIAVSQEPSTQYIEISENVYSAPRAAANLGDHICTCRPKGEDAGCGKQCLNRLMYFECSPTSCPCGSSCSNQVIQKAERCRTLQRFNTNNRGWGIRTSAAISDGAFILEYVGEVLTEAEFKTRTIELYHAYNDHYCVQLDATTVIDGYRMANEGRFVNHSCEPNCEMQKWCVNGEYRIGLFALREIEPGEELTYDYNFHAFNVDQQQACRCGSQKCRGIIGGKTQRSLSSESDVATTPGQSVSTVKVTKAKQTAKGRKADRGEGGHNLKDDDLGTKEFSILQMKPLSSLERNIIRIRQLFLIRNLTQVRRKEEEQQKKLAKKSVSSDAVPTHSKSSHKSKAKKNQQNKEESKRVEEAITELYTAIATCKDQNGVSVAIPFMNLPSKKKNPEYYERISNPIDLSVIERNIMSHHYKDIENFNNDVQRVFKNAEKYHGRKSTLGKDVTRLRKAYAIARGKVSLLMNGHKKQSKTCEMDSEDLDEENENIHRKNEDHIRCICCIYKDEGLMVQCEKCYVWQHCDCMGVKPGNTDRYLCEECDPRPVSREVKVIPPPPNTPPGHTYYVTLLRDNILVKQGDCAYLMRDHRLRHNSDVPSMRALNRNLANIPQESLDIFRIEKLWTDERGDKYAYGYHFLRPHETHHSPSRTFYPNELFVSPFYEIIPLEAVVGLCIVMDLYTYCKGKPKGFKMSEIYICDFRIDKAAGIFTRINKKRFPICTKPHVFDTYKHRLCPKKTFQPHQVPEQYKKPVGRPPSKPETNGEVESEMDLMEKEDEDLVSVIEEEESCLDEGTSGSNTEGHQCYTGEGKWTKKRQRLEGIAHKLLSKLPKQAVDVSYLLEPGAGKRQRKKTLLSLESLSQQK